MSCPDGSCLEPIKRRRAIIVFGAMMILFILLSGFSFVQSRGQVTPDKVFFGQHHATDGKRVFQAYNCMGCHTMVGNGAYFAPDLTKEYEQAGPAWLAAFLPSAGAWPTETAVKIQLADPDIAADAGVSTIEEYYAKFPGAQERVERRGGGKTYMPNLPFRTDEVGQLIAFMKYSSAMNNEGWPPKVMTGTLEERLELLRGKKAVAAAASVAPAGADTAATESGQEIANNIGCMACHSASKEQLPDAVGPAWGGLFGSEALLDNGSKVTVDEAYLIESIQDPNAKVVAGYQPGIMPSYKDLITEEQIQAIVEYIKTLK